MAAKSSGRGGRMAVDNHALDGFAGKLDGLSSSLSSHGSTVSSAHPGSGAFGVVGQAFAGRTTGMVSDLGSHIGAISKATSGAAAKTRGTAADYRSTESGNSARLRGINDPVKPPTVNMLAKGGGNRAAPGGRPGPVAPPPGVSPTSWTGAQQAAQWIKDHQHSGWTRPPGAQGELNPYIWNGKPVTAGGPDGSTYGGKVYHNNAGSLPSGPTYHEYDVFGTPYYNDAGKGKANRTDGTEPDRLVFGSDGSVHYSNDHYGSFHTLNGPHPDYRPSADSYLWQQYYQNHPPLLPGHGFDVPVEHTRKEGEPRHNQP